MSRSIPFLQPSDRQRRELTIVKQPSQCRWQSVAIFVLGLSACVGDEPAERDGAYAVVGASSQALYFTNGAQDRVALVQTDANGASQHVVELMDSQRQRWVWSMTSTNQAGFTAFLAPKPSSPESKKKDQPTPPPQGEIVHLAAPGAQLQRWPLALTYASAAAEPGGRFIVLHNGQNRALERGISRLNGSDAPNGIFNRNLVEIVDLSKGEVSSLTLAGFGGELHGALFPTGGHGAPGEVTIGGVNRRIVAFSARGELILADLQDPAKPQVAVRLEQGYDAAVDRIALRASDPLISDPVLFVRLNGLADLVALTLRPAPSGQAGFRATYSLISTLAPAADFEPVHIAGEPWIASATALGLVFTNLNSAEQLALSDFGALSEVEVAKVGEREVVYAWNAGGRAIYRWDLATVNTSLGRTPESFALGGAIHRVQLAAPELVIAATDDGFYFADYAAGRLTPMVGVNPQTVAWQLSGDYMYIAALGHSSASRINLTSLVPETQELTATAMRLDVLGNGDKVAVLQQDDEQSWVLGELASGAAKLAEMQEHVVSWSNGGQHD